MVQFECFLQLVPVASCSELKRGATQGWKLEKHCCKHKDINDPITLVKTNYYHVTCQCFVSAYYSNDMAIAMRKHGLGQLKRVVSTPFHLEADPVLR